MKEVKMIKKLNILYSYQRINIIGGLETRLIDEFKCLKKQGHQVHFVTNKNNFKASVAEIYENNCEFVLLEVGKTSNAVDLIILTDQLVNTIESNNINCVSVHMQDDFALATIMAAQICHIPVISTIHGIFDIYRKPLSRLVIQKLAMKSVSLLITVSKTMSNIYPQPLTIIPNMINLDNFKNHSSSDSKDWLVVSRISKEKFPSIIKFLQVAQHCGIPNVDIAGGGDSKKLKEAIKDLNITQNVRFLGECQDISARMANYQGIAGMGRVVAEGLASKRMVCVLTIGGELKGLVTPRNFERFKNYNFSGRTQKNISLDEFQQQIASWNKAEEDKLYQLVCNELSTENWNNYIKKYQDVTFVNNPALESFYHKLAFFAKNISTPYIDDAFFQQLFYETLLDFQCRDIIEAFHYYDNNRLMNKAYPNPLTKDKKKWYKF